MVYVQKTKSKSGEKGTILDPNWVEMWRFLAELGYFSN